MNCLKNFLNLKKPFSCIKFCTKQIMIKKKNSKLVNIFNSGLEDLEKEIKEISK